MGRGRKTNREDGVIPARSDWPFGPRKSWRIKKKRCPELASPDFFHSWDSFPDSFLHFLNEGKRVE
jgi:hypothetical protein